VKDVPVTSLEGEYLNLDPLATRIRIHRTCSEEPDDVEQAVIDVLDPGCRSLLDIGSGTGSFLGRLAGLGTGLRLYALDSSPAAVAEAAAIDGVIAQEGDACANPFETSTFDCVTARHMLYHVPDLHQALVECGRVLRPGGQLVAVVNNPESTPHVVALVTEVVTGLGVTVPPTPNSLVNSDNLPAAVDEVFDDVAVTLHENALVFARPQPLAEFSIALLAFYGVARGSDLYEPAASALVSRAEEWFRAGNGPWRDPKGYSVTVARKAAGGA
jgi:SAM-dependent methyltransferase